MVHQSVGRHIRQSCGPGAGTPETTEIRTTRISPARRCRPGDGPNGVDAVYFIGGLAAGAPTTLQKLTDFVNPSGGPYGFPGSVESNRESD